MGVQNPNSTSYVHPDEPNLLNLHKAMEYDETGVPHVRVRLGTDNVTITGNVNLVDNVRVNNTEAQMIPVYIVGNTIAVTQGTTPWNTNANIIGNIAGITTLPAIRGNVWVNGITGNVSITQLPAITGNVWINGITGNLAGITQLPAISVTGNIFGITQLPAITGNVGVVGNVNVTQGTTPWTVSGTVTATIANTVTIAREESASTVTAFGEQYGITITPVIQLDSIYGITNEVIQTYTNGTGSVANASPQTALFQVSSGSTVGGYGVLRSKRFLRYRPGQGALARFTAAFTPNVALTSQRAGLANQENAIQVGWNDPGTGPKFGVLRASGGRTHITVLTINTAPTGAQTANVTLNGVSYNISITSGTAQATAVAINNIDGFTGWLTDQVDNTIVFMSTTLGAKSGTYSFSSSGAGTLATGTFSTKQVGVAQTENWTYQENFNIDTLGANIAGPNPSGMTLRSQYLNVYQINFRWLGVGEIRYAIEDQATGHMVFFHKEHYTNQHNVTHTSQPSFKIGYVAYSTGSTSNVTVTGASMMGAIEGTIQQNELNRSTSVSKTSISQNTLQHLLTIRNPYVTNGQAGALNGNYVLNAKEIILKDISIGTQNTDPAIVYIFFEPTSFTGTHSYYSQPRDNGMVSTADGTFNATVDTAICQFVTAINGESQYKLSDFRIAIPPGSYISFAIKSTNNISRVSMALVFSED